MYAQIHINIPTVLNCIPIEEGSEEVRSDVDQSRLSYCTGSVFAFSKLPEFAFSSLKFQQLDK